MTGTSPLKPTEKCTLEGITKTKMMKPNISVNSVRKHLTRNLNLTTTGICTGYSIIGCFKLRKRKRQQGRPKKRLVNKENPVLPKVVLQPVSLLSQAQPELSQPELSQPELSQPELSQPELSQPPLPQIPDPQPPLSLPVSFDLPPHLTAQSSQMFPGQLVLGTAIKKQEEEEMEIGGADN